MGAEARCEVRWGRQHSEGKALLESNELRFSGTFRLVIPFREITKLAVKDGELAVTFTGGTARFALGAAAPKWADKIRNPKTLLDKLGVKPGQNVVAIRIGDESFLSDLAKVVEHVGRRPGHDADLIFFGLETKEELARLLALREALAPAGAIWAVWTKGRPELKEDHIRAAAIKAGLVDVKVAAFSPTLSALKLVIPKARR
jgi:hypothetical protein